MILPVIDSSNECYSCEHRIDHQNDALIGCNRPDPEMTGHVQGVDGGWFDYPKRFAAIWKQKRCRNFSSVYAAHPDLGNAIHTAAKASEIM